MVSARSVLPTRSGGSDGNRVCFWLYAYKKFLVALFMIRKMEEGNLPVSIANIRFDMGICIRYNRIQAEANFPGKKSNGKEQLLHSKYKKWKAKKAQMERSQE